MILLYIVDQCERRSICLKLTADWIMIHWSGDWIQLMKVLFPVSLFKPVLSTLKILPSSLHSYMQHFLVWAAEWDAGLMFSPIVLWLLGAEKENGWYRDVEGRPDPAAAVNQTDPCSGELVLETPCTEIPPQCVLKLGRHRNKWCVQLHFLSI